MLVRPRIDADLEAVYLDGCNKIFKIEHNLIFEATKVVFTEDPNFVDIYLPDGGVLVWVNANVFSFFGAIEPYVKIEDKQEKDNEFNN